MQDSGLSVYREFPEFNLICFSIFNDTFPLVSVVHKCLNISTHTGALEGNFMALDLYTPLCGSVTWWGDFASQQSAYLVSDGPIRLYSLCHGCGKGKGHPRIGHESPEEGVDV
jgi:hypothetical protein